MVISLMFLSISLSAQFYKPNETTLRIGDSVPDTFWSVQHQFVDMQTDSLYTADLSPYRDKLLILDFWASWCGPCVFSLGKMKDLRLEYPDADFEVVPVAYEPFLPGLDLANRIQKLRWPFQSLVQDSVLGYNFPHNGIPHMVWIYQGKVIAKPKWDYATIENIKAVLSGKQTKLVNIHQDWAIDLDREFFVNGNGETEIVYGNSEAKIGRYITGYQTEFTQIQYREGKTIMYAINVPLSHIYYEAFKMDIHPLLDWREGNGLTWAIKDTFRKQFLSDRPKQSVDGDLETDSVHEAWNRKNLYSFVIQREGLVKEEEMRQSFQKHVNTCFQDLLGIYADIYPYKILKYATLRTDDLASTLKRLGEPVDGERPPIKQIDGSQRYTSYRALTGRVTRYLQTLTDEDLEYGMLVDSTGISMDHGCDFLLPKYKRLTYKELKDLLSQFGIQITIENKRVPALLIQQVSKDYQF